MPRPTKLTPSLRRKQKQAIRLAKEYRKKHGSAIDNLSQVLNELVKDEEQWREIVEEPYG